jgi:hypothetical protein
LDFGLKKAWAGAGGFFICDFGFWIEEDAAGEKGRRTIESSGHRASGTSDHLVIGPAIHRIIGSLNQ